MSCPQFDLFLGLFRHDHASFLWSRGCEGIVYTVQDYYTWQHNRETSADGQVTLQYGIFSWEDRCELL